MNTYRIWHTADLTIPDCEGGCPEADACARGYVDMSWSRWTVYPDRDNVRPDVFDPSDYACGCREIDCTGCLTPVMWLADRLNELPGGPEGMNGDTFYGADGDGDYGVVARRAIHAEGFSDGQLAQAYALYKQRQAALSYDTVVYYDVHNVRTTAEQYAQRSAAFSYT